MPRWWWTATVGLVLLLAACGGSGGTATTSSAATTTTAVLTSTITSVSAVPSPPSSPTTSTVTEIPTSPQQTTASTGPGANVLPAVSLPGANDPDCRSTLPPVVLLHGTLARAVDNYATLAPILRASGRCVYAVDYGNGGIGPVATSAQQFAALVRTVRNLTGAAAVDVVAYSQGGLVLRTALREDGLAEEVGVAVLLAPAFHGTTSLAGNVPAALCPACADLAAGSALVTRLDAGGDLDGAVRYAVVSTNRDTVVTPLSSQVPKGPADRVRSVVVQDVCPRDAVDHIGLPADRGVIGWTLAALQQRGRPSASALKC